MKRRNKYLQIPRAEIDLHGLTKEEAKEALENFLIESKSKKYKKVRVIIGKGLHLESGRGVLNEYMRKVLNKEDLKYSDAKIFEGGSGAINVCFKSQAPTNKNKV